MKSESDIIFENRGSNYFFKIGPTKKRWEVEMKIEGKHYNYIYVYIQTKQNYSVKNTKQNYSVKNPFNPLLKESMLYD